MCLPFCHSSHHIPDIEVLTVIFFSCVFSSPFPISFGILSRGPRLGSFDGRINSSPLLRIPKSLQDQGKPLENTPRKHKLKDVNLEAKIGAQWLIYFLFNLISLQAPQWWEKQQWGGQGGAVCSRRTCRDQTQIFAFLSLLLPKRHRGDLFFNLGVFDTSEIASGSKIKAGILWHLGAKIWFFGNWGSTSVACDCDWEHTQFCKEQRRFFYVGLYKFCLGYWGKKKSPPWLNGGASLYKTSLDIRCPFFSEPEGKLSK